MYRVINDIDTVRANAHFPVSQGKVGRSSRQLSCRGRIYTTLLLSFAPSLFQLAELEDHLREAKAQVVSLLGCQDRVVGGSSNMSTT